MTPNTFSLVSVSTREDKRGVDVTFANEQRKQLKFYSFFPSFYLPHTSTNAFEQLLNEHIEERHQIISHPKSIQVIAGTWNDLKQIAHHIHTLTNYYPSLIEPERQFLLTQKWNYFQTFDEKLNPLPQAFSETKIEGMAEGVIKTLKQIHTHNPNLENQLTQKMVLAHELAIPLSDVPMTSEEQMEIVLENHFFNHQQPAPLNKGEKLNRSTWNVGQRDKISMQTWNMSLENESQCTCCVPTSLVDSHVQVGSEIACTIVQDGVYLHTLDDGRSQNYHATHAQKEKRILRAKEWGLHVLPMGPFWRNETISLSLNEAKQAHEQGLVKMHVDPASMKWKCRKTEPVLGQLHARLKQKEEWHSAQQTKITQPYLTQYQLAYTLHTQQNPLVQIHAQGSKLVREWTQKLPLYLQTGETPWRDTQLAKQWVASVE